MTITTRVENYMSKVENFHIASENAAIWLFLGTIGCWGVEDMKFRITSFFVIFLLFIYQLVNFKKDNNIYKRFDHELTDLIDEIYSTNSIDKYKDELLNKLLLFKKENFGWFGFIKKGGVFTICLLYFYYSCIYQLTHLSM